MKNVIKSFAALAASLLAFNACQQELAPEQPAQEELFYVTFVAEEPATKTTVVQGVDGEGNKVANYSWTASDANSERWTVYRGTEAATSVTPSLSDDVMTLTVGFSSPSVAGDKFVAVFNKGVGAVQNIPDESVYDPASDVMVSAPVAYETGVSSYGFRFKRLGAIGKATVKGLSGMEALMEAKLIATDGSIIVADYNYESKSFESTGSTKISVKSIDCYPDASNNFSFYFITVPTESVNLKVLVTTLDDQAEERMFVKQLGRAITGFAEGDVFAFNVSGFTEVTTRAHFNINGKVTSKPVYEGEPVEFPEAPAKIAGYDFVGWSKSSISGTQQEAPELVETSTEVMGKTSVPYYAVYAKTTGDGTATHTITYETENIPESYGASADVVLNGVTFNVTQMYKNGEKMQWRAAGNNNGTGALYNKDAFNSIQSVAITYTNEDNKKNFTVKVGDSANPTSGTDIDAAQVGETDTFVYDCSSSAPSYFVLTNGENAGYLSSIVITYLVGEPTYADYCTSIDTRTVTSLAWSAPLATVKLNGDDNKFPELTGDPEEVMAAVVYSSSKTSVADIDESGAVTLKAVGETTITAAFPDGDKDYQPSSASYTLVVTAPAKHTVTFSINGDTSSENVDENDPINFPEDPSIDGVLFLGWVKEALDAPQQTAPTCVVKAEETMGTDDVTYYAVFYKRSGSEPSEDLAQTLQYDTWSYSGSTTDKSSYRLFHSGSYIESADFDRSKLTKVIVYGGTFGGDSYNKLTIGDGTNTWKSVTVSGSSQTGMNTYINGTALSGTGKLRITSNSGSASNNGVRISKVEIYVQTGGYVYSDYCTTVITLRSIAISGSVTNTTYDAGDVLDPTGLTVTATYTDNSHADVTSLVEWSFSPATLPAGNNQSCTATANYGGKTASKEISGLTVNEVEPQAPSFTTQPSASATYSQNATATALNVVATGNPTPSLQWYSNSTNSNAGGSAIQGATGASYTPSTTTVGTTYYYCVATNSEGSAASNVSKIEVTAGAQTRTLETMATSGDIVKDIITFTTAKNSGTSSPAVNSGQLRLYQCSSADLSKGTRGGSITIKASTGHKIKKITITNANSNDCDGGTVAYQVNGAGSWSGSAKVNKNTTYSTGDNLDASSVEIACFGKTNKNRLYITKIVVEYY